MFLCHFRSQCYIMAWLSTEI